MSDSSDPSLIAVIIEDDPDVRTLLDEVFRSAGFETVLVGSGVEGVAAVQEHQPAITTLDINLPGIDGFEVARRIRKVSSTFLLMLSALAEESDVVLGLGSGADEYLVKPFRPRELRARIEAALRRPRFEKPDAAASVPAPAPAASMPLAPAPAAPSAATAPSPSATVVTADAHRASAQTLAQERAEVVIPARNPTATAAVPLVAPADGAERWWSHRDLSLNLETRTALVSQKEVDLTLTEFDLLATLLESKRRVRSKSDLALVVRGDAFGTSFYVGEPDKRAIEAHIANLRRKIGDNSSEPRYIETVRGVGYRLTSQMEPAEVAPV